MKSEAREKDVRNIDEMLERGLNFYVLDASEEFVAEMPKVVER